MRDLGGVLNKRGENVLLNKFIRSNLPVGLDEADVLQLHDLGISTVIDLRTSQNVAEVKNDLDHPLFQYKNVELKGEVGPQKEEDIPQGYIEILDDSQSVKRVLEAIANAQGGVIFNCNAGKDRTGVIAFILLSILEVPMEDILADYQISYTYLRDMIRKMHQDNPGLPSFRGQSKIEYMEKTAALFYTKYESLQGYLSSAGVTASVADDIKKKGFSGEYYLNKPFCT